MRCENLRVYIIHYTPFVERRAHMETLLGIHGLDRFPVRWISEHDREEILEDYQAGKYGDPAKIAASSVSLILKHLAAYRMAAAEPEGLHLILEDDILVKPGLLDAMETRLSELPEDWELFFIGEGCNLHVPWWRRRPGQRVYFRGWKPWFRGGAGTSRCTEAYFVRPAFARRFLDSKFARWPWGDTAIDWLLAEAGYDLHIRSYWAEPPLITQGAFQSWTLDPKLNPRLRS